MLSDSELRFAFAAGYDRDDLAALTEKEQVEFDTLVFRKYGPDQVTFGTIQEQRLAELEMKIQEYTK